MWTEKQVIKSYKGLGIMESHDRLCLEGYGTALNSSSFVENISVSTNFLYFYPYSFRLYYTRPSNTSCPVLTLFSRFFIWSSFSSSFSQNTARVKVQLNRRSLLLSYICICGYRLLFCTHFLIIFLLSRLLLLWPSSELSSVVL